MRSFYVFLMKTNNIYICNTVVYKMVYKIQIEPIQKYFGFFFSFRNKKSNEKTFPVPGLVKIANYCFFNSFFSCLLLRYFFFLTMVVYKFIRIFFLLTSSSCFFTCFIHVLFYVWIVIGNYFTNTHKTFNGQIDRLSNPSYCAQCPICCDTLSFGTVLD
jgi:hypothetical protein